MAWQPAAMPARGMSKEQLVFVACLFLLLALAWLILQRMTEVMAAPGGMADMAMAGMPMPWSVGDAALMFAMWAVMMVGMMLPSALPMFLLYQMLLRRRMPSPQRHWALLLFCAAYLVVWGSFSLIATLLQWGLDHLALLDVQMRSASTPLAAVLLIAAGVWQWLPAKSACLERCRGPMQFLLTGWRPGVTGGWHLGLAHGAWCLGCCWALMGLLFVVGVMNLLWVALIGAFVLFEKTLPLGLWLSRAGGLLLVGWGAALLLP
ncbi:DUF2182 domain-containing protein [Pseudomonas indica]|uniref:DUF2182 domain-containing protein n=1 Tax=Pseudomonas indica TaxID=137658 RepID=UPI0023F67D66|nr:DUF2182 domain-containing protein [Pseudomonas indica]MBU3058113.1 DUF2182 domain-containing protein [Pseudomonas indica]